MADGTEVCTGDCADLFRTGNLTNGNFEVLYRSGFTDNTEDTGIVSRACDIETADEVTGTVKRSVKRSHFVTDRLKRRLGVDCNVVCQYIVAVEVICDILQVFNSLDLNRIACGKACKANRHC